MGTPFDGVAMARDLLVRVNGPRHDIGRAEPLFINPAHQEWLAVGETS